jgi:hypothetical protein
MFLSPSSVDRNISFLNVVFSSFYSIDDGYSPKSRNSKERDKIFLRDLGEYYFKMYLNEKYFKNVDQLELITVFFL